MGLISKIEDKLAGSSSSKTEQSSYEPSSSGSGSKLQHPISSSTGAPTGTAVGSTSSTDRDGYGSQPSGYGTTSSSAGRQGYDTQPSGYGTTSSSAGRQGYDTQPSGYNTTTSSSRMPGTYETETRTAPSGYGSDKMPSTTTNTTTTSSTDQRQYYDPYSRKGQQTAASAATGYGMSPSTTSNTSPNADANVARSQRGGVLNQQEDQRYDPNARSGYASTGNQDLSSVSGEPALRHHYGRDAAVAGGAGAAGVGAYEMGQHSSGTSQQPTNYSHPQPSSGMVGSDSSPTVASGTGVSGSSSGMEGKTQAEKMAKAYENGFQAGMEHMKSELHKIN